MTDNKKHIDFFDVITIILQIGCIGFIGFAIGGFLLRPFVEERTTVAGTVEYDLYYFCEMPVQKTSGNIEGSIVWGSGNMSGNIYTYDTLPYWYDNGMGRLCFNSVKADNSKIIPIEEGETSFVRITTYCTQKVGIKRLNGKEYIINKSCWDEYEFHIPI